MRVRGHVASGDTLVPSMRHDGTAVAMRQGDHTPKEQSPQLSSVLGIAMSTHEPATSHHECDSDVGAFVTALITPPSAQQQQQRRHVEVQPVHQEQLANPANEFVAFQRRSALHNRPIMMPLCAAALAVLVAISVLALYIGSRDGSTAPAGSNSIDTARDSGGGKFQNACDGVDCGPGGNCSAINGSATLTCDCPAGASLKWLIKNHSRVPQCELNLCTSFVDSPWSNMNDPVASHTVQWAKCSTDCSSTRMYRDCHNVRSGERCQYECDPGYQQTDELMCMPNGTLVGGGCTPLQCAPVVIAHSNRSQSSTACSGVTGATCEFECASGYVRAPTSSGPLSCSGSAGMKGSGAPPAFATDFAFRVSGTHDREYSGIYTKTNLTCAALPVYQRHSASGFGPVLFAVNFHPGVQWVVGPSAIATDCKGMYPSIYNDQSECIHSASGLPDDVACNPPMNTWSEYVGSSHDSCDGVSDCQCTLGSSLACEIGSPQLRIERVALRQARATSSTDIDRGGAGGAGAGAGEGPSREDEETADRLFVPAR